MRKEIRKSLATEQRDLIHAMEVERKPFFELCRDRGVSWEQLCRWFRSKWFRRALRHVMRVVEYRRELMVVEVVNAAVEQLHEIVTRGSGDVPPAEVAARVAVLRDSIAAMKAFSESTRREALLDLQYESKLAAGQRRESAQPTPGAEERDLFHPATADGLSDEQRLRRLEAFRADTTAATSPPRATPDTTAAPSPDAASP